MSINTADSRVAAQAVHDVGAALWFGGSVMGVAGVNPRRTRESAEKGERM